MTSTYLTFHICAVVNSVVVTVMIVENMLPVFTRCLGHFQKVNKNMYGLCTSFRVSSRNRGIEERKTPFIYTFRLSIDILCY